MRKFKAGDLEGVTDTAHEGARDDTHIGGAAKANEFIEHEGNPVPPHDDARPVPRDDQGGPVEQGPGQSPDEQVDSAEEKSKTPRQRRKEANNASFDTPIEQTHLHGPDSSSRSTDPKDYELVIDNDSGTYRPDKELLPQLEKFLRREFEGLHILALDCQDERLKKIKKKQEKAKEKAAGGRKKLIRTGSDSSLSSSDEEDVEAGRRVKGTKEKVYDAALNPVGMAKGKIDGMLHKDGEGEGEQMNEKT